MHVLKMVHALEAMERTRPSDMRAGKRIVACHGKHPRLDCVDC